MSEFFKNYFLKVWLVIFAGAAAISFFSAPLAGVLLLCFLLGGAAWRMLDRMQIEGKRKLMLLLLIGLVIHGSMITVIAVTGFRPTSGGADYEGYQAMATEIAWNVWSGNFSLDGVRGGHDFTLIIGGGYALFSPHPAVGAVLVLGLFIVALASVFLLVLELGGSPRIAFIAGLIVCLYPSYLYFGSLLLKDTLIIPLALIALLLCVKICKSFSWPKFLVFFLVLASVIHLRFYIGYAIMFAFLICWFLVAERYKKHLFWQGFLVAALLGCAPMLATFNYYDYYGAGTLWQFATPQQVTLYREVSYNPDAPNNESSMPAPGQQIPVNTVGQVPSGFGSSFVVETGLSGGPVNFVTNSLITFFYGWLGPFPWQLRYLHQYVVFLEVVPWYALLAVFFWGMVYRMRRQNLKILWREKKYTAIPILFAGLAMAALTLFINNYGIILRIRIPMVIAIVVAGLIVGQPIFETYYEKLFSYGRSWIHRLASR
jgi:hypothetical protein